MTHPVSGRAPAMSSIDVTTEVSRGRATAPPAARQFREFLARSGMGVLGGAAALARAVGAPRAVAAAMSSGAEALSTREGGSLGELDSLVGASTAANDHYLLLQEQISAENRRFTALSNVLKARHDTAKAAVNNIR